MTALKNLKGRPELKEGKRNRKIDVRFSESEYAIILEIEKDLGISRTELVRMRLLNDAKNITVNGKELLKHLDGIGAEMGRSGNNINQLAKHANYLKLRGDLSPLMVSEFDHLLGQYVQQQRQLEIALRKIIRLMGK